MITHIKGDILKANTEAIINPVNCVGVMGKGLALDFKKAFPENFKAYKKACDAKEVQPGKLFIFETESEKNPKYIVNFPTKQDWREQSKLTDIESGLKALWEWIQTSKISSITIPRLGCGLGGLDWGSVLPLIENTFSSELELQVFLIGSFV